jgi:hypothetical protein
MNYTYQTHTESGCFASPQPDDVQHATSKAELRRALECWADTVDRYSDEPATLIVWHGKHADITDLYPSFECRLGKRGGFFTQSV